MQNFLERIDKFAGIDRENKIAGSFERTAVIFLVLMVLSAPHSIAATQIAWLTGMFVWVIRLVFIRPRPRLIRTPLDVPLWTFFIWTVLTSVFSYQPLISLDKLRGAALFLIFHFVINNLRNRRSIRFLALALIASCMVNVLWTPIERIFGRGVEIHGLSPESPLKKALLWEGDTLLKANGKKLETPDQLVAEIKQNEITKVEFYRPDFYFTVEVKRVDLLPDGDNSSSLENLGISSWKKSRNWRSQGFYGHYATYAEVLQLIVSLVFGLFMASVFNRENELRNTNYEKSGIQNLKSKICLFFCLTGMACALLLTVTRASQLGFLISASVIVLLGGSRKMLLILAAIALPVIVGGLIFLQQTREVGFFDRSDDSIIYRETVYREGINLWLRNPRHFFLGVGMDTITNKEYAARWHLFDNGKLPPGHFHSTPIQLLAERGLFGLIFWLFVVGIYLHTLWKAILRKGDGEQGDKETRRQGDKETGRHEDGELLQSENRLPSKKISLSPCLPVSLSPCLPVSLSPRLPISLSQFRRGLLLGCFGGAVGFFTSGLVHYNLGDGEVVMVFFLLMGLSLSITNCEKNRSAHPQLNKPQIE